MDQVELAPPRQQGELRDAGGRRPVAERTGRDVLEPARLDPVDERAARAVDDHLVAGRGGAGGEVDRVQLAAADAEVVRRHEQPHRTTPTELFACHGRAGTPAHTCPAGTGRVTTAPIPTSAPVPTVTPSRSSAPAPM